jgi:hypothetical protein
MCVHCFVRTRSGVMKLIVCAILTVHGDFAHA